MSAGEEKTAAPKTEQEPMAFLSDGIGLSYAEITEELARKSKTIVSPDDPIMMMVPLCNAFLSQQHALQERHKTALAQVMAAKTDTFVQSVQKTVEELGQTLTSATVQSLQTAFTEHREAMKIHETALQQHRSNIFWLSAIAVVSGLINVAVFVGIFLLRG